MFEETEWESNGADENLTKKLFLEFPKIKKKKNKVKVPRNDSIKGESHSDSVDVSDKSLPKATDFEKNECDTTSPKLTKAERNRLRKKHTKDKHVTPKKMKRDVQERAVEVNVKSGEKVNILKKKCVQGNKNDKPVTLVYDKSRSPIREHRNSSNVTEEKVRFQSKHKNKYKALIGDHKNVGRDVKDVKPLLDIPRKMKLAGINTQKISPAQVKVVINEMSCEKAKLKSSRKRKRQRREIINKTEGEQDNILTDIPQKKKRKKLKVSKICEIGGGVVDTGETKVQSSKSHLDSVGVQEKSKGKPKKVKKGSESSMESALQLTRKKSENQRETEKVDDEHHQSSVKSCAISNKLAKSPFNVSKLKSLLSKDEEKTINTEELGGRPEPKSAESIKSYKTGRETKIQKKAEKAKSLKETLEHRLVSSRFRFLNERLYTCTGEEALQMFREDADAFHCYHKGFQAQVEKWPDNPVDRVIAYLKARPASLVVADFGCGEAKVGQNVKNQVHSFDLVKVNEYVTVCDISKVPLEEGSIDVVVFCLSLMGTNFTDFLCEGSRVLKTGGVLLVAEVTSRFDRPTRFARKVEKLGFTLEKQDQSNKMFIWFEFKKTGDIPSEERIPKLELAPCYYKRR